MSGRDWRDAETLTVRDAARAAGITERTVYRWIASGRLSGEYTRTRYGAAWSIRPADLEAAMAAKP